MPRILIIDDEEEIRHSLRLIFESEGFDVEEEAEGGAGILNYRRNSIDLVITDIVMPGKEGIQTIIEMRREFPEAKIVALSGGGERLGRDTCLDMARAVGATKVVQKPVMPDALLWIVQDALG